MRSQKTSNPLFLQCFRRNRGLHSQEPPPPKTPNTHNVAHRSIIKGPLKKFKKGLRAQTPQKAKTHHKQQNACFAMFSGPLSDMFFAFLTKFPSRILTSTFSCPLFLTCLHPKKKHRNTYFYSLSFLKIQELCSEGFLLFCCCCIVFVVVVAVVVVANLKNSKKHRNKEKPT